jgi:hypothetical protein
LRSGEGEKAEQRRAGGALFLFFVLEKLGTDRPCYGKSYAPPLAGRNSAPSVWA